MAGTSTLLFIIRMSLCRIVGDAPAVGGQQPACIAAAVLTAAIGIN
jgi:hypothetical protein